MNPRSLVLPLLALPLVGSVGCYDKEALVERARNHAAQGRLEEVPLGDYRITLPLDQDTGLRSEVVLSLVGTTVHYRQDEVTEHVAANVFRLRQATVTAVRQTTPQELADPELVSLRERLLKSANEALGDLPVDSIAIAQLSLVPQ